MVPASSTGARLLLIDDDTEIAETIVQDLSARSYRVTHAETGPDGLAAALAEPFDLLIVDRMLPGMDGLTLIQALRARDYRMPVLVLSALNAVDERVRGLKAGGDDYLTKPFALIELAARIEALLRRPSRLADTIVRLGALEIDLVKREAMFRGQKLDLLPREFKLLDYMARRPGQLLTRAMLLEDVWNYRFVPQSNLVDVHLGKLRRKLEQVSAPMIESIRGEGYAIHAVD